MSNRFIFTVINRQLQCLFWLAKIAKNSIQYFLFGYNLIIEKSGSVFRRDYVLLGV